MLWPTLELMLGAAVVIVLWIGGRQVLMGKMNVGDFVAFNTYMVQLTWPVIALGWVINIFQRGTASMARIEEILSQQPEIADESQASSHEPRATSKQGAPSSQLEARGLIGEVEFRNLNFAYDGVSVLKNINLRIPAGSSLAIVGPTGSGKTTLVNLIPRIYDAEPGAVLIDGRPVREFPLDSLRRHIGFVPQETFLFSDTIRENIAFGVSQEDNAGRWPRLARRHQGRRRSRQHRARHREFPRRLQHRRGRTRHHPLRRPEAAHRHRPRPAAQPAHPDSRRRPLQRRHPHRRQDPQPSPRNHARTHHHLHLPPRLHRPQRRLASPSSTRDAS
jgi:hypothetical protein